MTAPERSLLRVEQTTKVESKPRPESTTRCGVDSGGQVLKAEQDALGKIVTFRTTKKPCSPGGPFNSI